MDVIKVLEQEKCPKCGCCALVLVVCAECEGMALCEVGCPDCEFTDDPDCETCDGRGEVALPCEVCDGSGNIKICDGGCINGKHARPIFGAPVRMARDCEYAWQVWP